MPVKLCFDCWGFVVLRGIDYQIATAGIAAAAKSAAIYKATRFSDHAPLIIDYDFDL